MSEPQFGRQDALLTEAELYEFRFLTTALAWSNPIEKKAKGNTRTPNPDHEQAKLYRFAADLTDLLVRHVEVVAVTASDGDQLLFQTACDNSDELLAEDDPEDVPDDAENESAPAATVGYAQNPRDEQRSKTLGDKDHHHPALNVNIPSTTADEFGPSIGCWLLSKTERALKAVTYPKTSVSFSEHAANIVSLIKDTYEETATEDVTVARDQLRNYVLLTSTAKIVLRIQKGTIERNLYEYLSQSGSSLSDIMSDNDYQFKSMLLGTDMFESSFTEDERKVITSTIDILELRCANNRDDLPKRSWEAFDNTRRHVESLGKLKGSLANGESLIYDQDTAHHIQNIISLVLDNLVASFERLATMKRQAQLYKSGNYDQLADATVSNNIALAGASLDKLSAEAGTWLDVLTRLKQTLRKYLLTNFQLLRKVYGLKNVKRSEDIVLETQDLSGERGLQTQANRTLSESKTEQHTPEMFSTGVPKTSTHGHYSSSIATDEIADTDNEDPTNVVSRLHELKLEKQRKTDPEIEQLDAIAERTQWEDAAIAWLDLVCLHWTAFLSLSGDGTSTRRNKAYKAYVRKANFQHFEASQDHRDRRLDVKTYLDNFTMKSGSKLTEEERQKIRAWLLKDGYGYSAKAENEHAAPTNFTGTYHCETILMSLFLLGQKREEIVDNTIGLKSPELEENMDDTIGSESPELSTLHLQLPSKTTTDALQSAMAVLPVSKRCCPACHALVLYFRKYVNADLIYPGNHSVWSAAALPPWIPRKAGLKVLKAAREALQSRFKTILKPKASSPPKLDGHIKSDDTSPEFHE